MTSRIIRWFQIALTNLALIWFRLPVAPRPITWMVGVDEIAGMVRRIADIVEEPYSVVLARHRSYGFEYDALVERDRPLWLLRRIVVGPVLLARAATRARGVIYVGASGFLLTDLDRRAWEMRLLRRHGRAVVSYFVGDDIRAPRLMHELEATTGVVNVSTMIGQVSAEFESDAYDETKRRIAAVADTYSNAIFSWRADQRSYLRRPTLPVTYFYPDDLFGHVAGKFDDLSRPVVVHAPTSGPLKGTEHVRSAVERLRAEGIEFEYVELIGVGNDVVLRELRRAHIVLNQFYAFVPGVFGSEAMAARTAVLMSADPTMEPELPGDPPDAWLVARPDTLEQVLRDLLTHPERIRPLAERGEEWARRHVAYSSAGPVLRAQLAAVLRDGDAEP